jgi:hypothetical protein
MVLERINDEILIRLSSNVKISELQDVLDFIKYQENTGDSEANQQDVDELSDQVNSTIWKDFKDQRKL